MKKLIAAAAVLAMTLAGCADVDHGTVVDKNHADARTDIIWQQNCFPTGPNGAPICTPIMMPVSYPEYWELRLKNDTDEGWHSVSEDEFNKYQVGDKYP